MISKVIHIIIGYSGNVISAINNCCGFAVFAFGVSSGMSRHFPQYAYRFVGERIPHISDYCHVLPMWQNTAL